MTNDNDSGQPLPQSPVIPPAPAESEIRTDPKKKTESDQTTAKELAREFRWVEFAQLAVNGALAIIGIAALLIYHGQLDVMRGQLGEIIKQYPELRKSADAAKKAAEVTEKAFNLTTRRAEDSDQAVCTVRGETEKGNNLEHISIYNSGKVTAHDFSAHIEISSTSLPANKRLTIFRAFDVSQDELRVDTPVLRDFALAGLSQKDWNSISELREAIVASGRMQYENGFGSLRHIMFCQAFLTQPPSPGSVPQVPQNVLVDCDRLPAYLPPLYERLRTQAQH